MSTDPGVGPLAHQMPRAAGGQQNAPVPNVVRIPRLADHDLSGTKTRPQSDVGTEPTHRHRGFRLVEGEEKGSHRIRSDVGGRGGGVAFCEQGKSTVREESIGGLHRRLLGAAAEREEENTYWGVCGHGLLV